MHLAPERAHGRTFFPGSGKDALKDRPTQGALIFVSDAIRCKPVIQPPELGL